jgi:3-dehydroquinate synthase
MKRVVVELGSRSYTIEIGAGASRSAALLELCRGRTVAIVSDAKVGDLYGQQVLQFIAPACRATTIVLPVEESSKALPAVESLLAQLLTLRLDRSSVLIALGGGVIGDVVGFAAAIFQRGISFVQMPTTLLSMVDSSVGGKTGVNHTLGKNMIGAFHQPKLVCADIDFLQSLDRREVVAGLAEIIKHGAVADVAYLNSVGQSLDALLRFDSVLLSQVVARSCEIKASVVASDEREAGNRAILNFGHTFGHAIEAGLGYGQWLHGEAVGAGMVMAADLSVRLGSLPSRDRDQLVDIIGRAGLPTIGPTWPAEHYVDLMSTDKKSRDGAPQFVVLNGLGQATLRHAPLDLVHQTLRATTK